MPFLDNTYCHREGRYCSFGTRRRWNKTFKTEVGDKLQTVHYLSLEFKKLQNCKRLIKRKQNQLKG